MRKCLTLAVLAAACGQRDIATNDRAHQVAPPRSSQVPASGPQHVVFRSPEDCSKAEIAYASPEADLNLPHQVDGYIGLFPSVDVTADIEVGKHILLLDRLVPPLQILQRIPVTPALHAFDLRRQRDGSCRLVPGV